MILSVDGWNHLLVIIGLFLCGDGLHRKKKGV